MLVWLVYNWAGSNDCQVTLLHCGFPAFWPTLDYTVIILGKKRARHLPMAQELLAKGINCAGISIRVRQFHGAWVNLRVA